MAVTIMWEPADDHHNVYEIRQFIGYVGDKEQRVRSLVIRAEDLPQKFIVLFHHIDDESYSAYGMSKPANDIKLVHKRKVVEAIFLEAFIK